MGYDAHSNQRYLYVEMHRRELEAAAAEARLERQVRGRRWLRRYVGALFIAAGEALVYQPRDALGAECNLATSRKHG
jgi:hypothetical protein